MAGRVVVVQILRTNPLELVLGCFEVAVGNQDDADIMPFLDIRDHLPFFVEQEGRHLDRQLGIHPTGVLFERLFFDDAQDRQRKRIDAADESVAIAAWADLVRRFAERRAQTLT